MEKIENGRAVLYALNCMQPSNQHAPRYVKMQAAQWIDIIDGQDPEAHIDVAAYNTICSLLKIMIHPDLGACLYDTLEDYAWFLIVAVLCTVGNDGYRYYETALLEIARKNFKTFNAGVIFILLMLTEPRFSRFFSVAPDLKLSNELKLAVRKIIKFSPLLDRRDTFQQLRVEIRCLLNDNDFTPLAYSQDKLDGKLARAFLADEAGAMDSYTIEAMRSSQITLFTKLGIIMSTQYPNDNNGMIDEIDISKKTLDGFIENRRRFSLLYEPDTEYLTEDQWEHNDTILYQANPVAVNNARMFKSLRDTREMSVLYENKRENFLCKHCNIKYKGLGVEGYVEITKVRECKQEESLAFWKDKHVYLGLDLSATDDNTSVAMVTFVDGVIYAKVWGFIPINRIDYKQKKESVDYNKLCRHGVCFACGDDVIDYAFVERFILSLEETYGVSVLQCGYDRWNALSTIQKLEAAMIECVEIKQHSSVLHSPTKWLKEKILSKKFRYDENLLLEINFQNARCTEDTNKNKYVNKKKSNGKVDAVVSLINALYLLEQEQLYGESDFVAQY